MRLDVGLVFELLGYEYVRILLCQFLCFLNGAFHSFRTLGKHKLRAIGLEYFPPLKSHRLGHCQLQSVALDCSHHRKADTGVPGRRFDYDGLLLQQAGFFSLLYHIERYSVLYRGAGIEVLQFCDHFGVIWSCQFVQFYVRRSAYSCKYVIVDHCFHLNFYWSM